jgi:tRNA-splicing endonuclease subunit Sen2
VYHHFRSLGWVPRAGIKFGVDWLLYTRGPVFDHAEFGIVIIPSYTHPHWQNSENRLRKKTWQWFHSVLRVLSHVMKSVVLVYVDVPPPDALQENLDKGISAALGSYTVREIMIKRWSSNRNR